MSFSDNLFHTGAFNQAINLSCDNLNNVNNLDNLILEKLKEEVGDKCIKHGYIKKDTIKINKRSIGKLNSSRLNGSLNYEVFYNAEVCNPTNGQIIKCKIKNKNKMGLLAEAKPVLIVISDIKENSDLDIDDVINVKLLGSRFDLFDTQITAIGQLI